MAEHPPVVLQTLPDGAIRVSASRALLASARTCSTSSMNWSELMADWNPVLFWRNGAYAACWGGLDCP